MKNKMCVLRQYNGPSALWYVSWSTFDELDISDGDHFDIWISEMFYECGLHNSLKLD